MIEWNKTTIDDLCVKVTDGSHFSPKGLEHGYPMYSVKDMRENSFNDSDVKRISEKDYQTLVKADCRPLKDDILIAKDGSYLKHVFYCKSDLDAAILSSIAILRPKTDKIFPSFFQYILRNPYIKKLMGNYVSGVAIPRIILDDFKKIELEIPDLPTQKKIASILSTYDDLIENNQKRIDILEQMAQNIYKEWFVRFRFPNYENVEMVDGLPKGWEKVKLSKSLNTFSGKTATLEENGQFVAYGSNGIIGNSKDWNHENCLIVGRVGAYCGSINFFRKRFWATDNTILVYPKEEITNNFFLYYLLKSINLRNFAGGSAQPLLTQSTILDLKAIKPSTDLCEKFEKIIEPIFDQIEKLEVKNKILIQCRNRLLPRLLSGKLPVE